jgi:hypothetical protein
MSTKKTSRHRIMAPFDLIGTAEVVSIESGSRTTQQPVARLRDDRGREATCDDDPGLAGAPTDPAAMQRPAW